MIYRKSKSKEIIADGKEIKKIVEDTFNQMAVITGSTLGPGGKPVLIERDGLAPTVTKDGVTVAKSLGVSEAKRNIVIDAAKEICINTATEAGDGTTTAIVLGNELVKRGHAFLNLNAKYSPQKFINELKSAYDDVVVPYLQNVARPAETEEQLLQVATISANGDKEVADACVAAVLSAGDDGHVQINEGQGRITKVDTVDGYVLTTGLKELGQIGPVFINEKSNQRVKMDNGRVFLYDGSMNDLMVPGRIQDEITDETGFADGRPLIVMAHNFSDTALEAFAKSTKKGMTVVPVKVPRSGLPNGSSILLQDLAVYTGAVVYDPGMLDDIEEDGFGGFVEATVNMYESFILSDIEERGGDIENRIVELKSILDMAHSEYDKSHLRAHIAKLTGGVATILVGGSSDLEIREKKDRVEDAVEAIRSAIAEGVVSGGCSTHLVLCEMLKNHPDKKPSWVVLSDALLAPISRLLENCGEQVEDILPQLLALGAAANNSLPDSIFDALNHEFVEPFEAGIIEPAKVIRVSVGNALSVASLMMNLGGIVVVPTNPEMDMQMEMGRQAMDQMMNSFGDQ